MTLRSDHVAGAAFVVFGIVVFALSGDLPFGRLSAPGAGMMPKLLIILMVAFGIALIAGATVSARHSPRSTGATAATRCSSSSSRRRRSRSTSGSAFWSRCRCWCSRCSPSSNGATCCIAAAYSIGLTLFAYWLFGKALKAPLERGILGF